MNLRKPLSLRISLNLFVARPSVDGVAAGAGIAPTGWNVSPTTVSFSEAVEERAKSTGL